MNNTSTLVSAVTPPETPKKLECYSYTHAFSHEAPWPKCEYEADLAGVLRQRSFHVLPCATEHLTSYRTSDLYPSHAYAVVIDHPDTRYLILCSSETTYIHFMRNYAPLASIIDRVVSR